MKRTWLVLFVIFVLSHGLFAATWSKWNNITVGGTAGNVGKWNNVTIGTTTGNIGAWNGLVSPGSSGPPYYENFNCTQNPLTGCTTANSWTVRTGTGLQTNGTSVYARASGTNVEYYSFAALNNNMYAKLTIVGSPYSNGCTPVLRVSSSAETYYWLDFNSFTPSSTYVVARVSGTDHNIATIGGSWSVNAGDIWTFSASGTNPVLLNIYINGVQVGSTVSDGTWHISGSDGTQYAGVRCYDSSGTYRGDDFEAGNL